MDHIDRSEEPELNTDTPWSAWDDQGIRWGLDHNRSIEEIASEPDTPGAGGVASAHKIDDLLSGSKRVAKRP